MIFDCLVKDPKDILKKILESIDRREKLLVTYLNQHCFNIYCENKDYGEILDNNFLVYQADLGVYLALKYLFNNSVDKIDATEMNQLVLDSLIKKNIPVTLVGGDFDTKFINEESQNRNLNLINYHKGYFDESVRNDIVNEVSKVKSPVYIIGMGVPKQEIFAAELAGRLEACTIICVGSFLEYYLGTKKRTHMFFRETGLEWFFRLVTEPARMWKRYLIGIPLFIFRVFKIKWKNPVN
jgi:N-acetylglucosaminyldiphosphoundecaprenol N-acetyl-beta-D-mannosaminyltransferase